MWTKNTENNLIKRKFPMHKLLQGISQQLAKEITEHMFTESYEVSTDLANNFDRIFITL